MRKNMILWACGLGSLMAFTACTGDEGEQQANEKTPLQIASASISNYGEGTRVTETPDGNGSQWSEGDTIAVRIGARGATGTYTVGKDGEVKATDTPAYWQSEAKQAITAWYPAVDGAIDLSDQTAGLKYVLKATVPDVTPHDAVNLVFKHQLSKVRVEVADIDAASITDVAIKGYTSFSTVGDTIGGAVNPGYIHMMKATYTDGVCYEANLMPQAITAEATVQIAVGGKVYIRKMDNTATELKAGYKYAFQSVGSYTVPEEHMLHTTDEGQITQDDIEAAMAGTGELKVAGKINQKDLKLILESSESAASKLTVKLDLSEAAGSGLRIPDSTFMNIKNLVGITLPVGVDSIGRYAFSGCTGLNGITLPEGLTYIGWHALSECTSLNGVKLPNTLERIEGGAFSGCTNLESMHIPSSVEYIEGGSSYWDGFQGGGAFEKCTSLKSLTFDEGVTRLGNYVFSRCTSLTKVSLPETLTSLGDMVFSNCWELKEVHLPSRLGESLPAESVGVGAFSDCSSLTTPLYNKNVFVHYNNVLGTDVDYTLPAVEDIAPGAFLNFAGLKSIHFRYAVRIGAAAFAESGLKSVDLYLAKEIATDAFSGCQDLESVVNLNSHLSNDDQRLWNTFSGCSKLKSVSFGGPIGAPPITGLYFTFEGCTSLTTIEIPDYVGELEATFRGCSSLQSITLPASITRIGAQTFSGCTNMAVIECKAVTPPECDDDAFAPYRDLQGNEHRFPFGTVTVKVPAGSVDAYKSADPWYNFNIVSMDDWQVPGI